MIPGARAVYRIRAVSLFTTIPEQGFNVENQHWNATCRNSLDDTTSVIRASSSAIGGFSSESERHLVGNEKKIYI